MAATPKQSRCDLNGRWRVMHRVERSGLSRYVGLELEFDVTLEQAGEGVTGKGVKFIVGYELATRHEASTLSLEGRVEGDHVRLDFIERAPGNPSREIVGEIDWQVVTRDMLAGTFKVAAADTSGASRALRRDWMDDV